METAPLEIWTEIFAFACTDDGTTSRALSVVSRTVHIMSMPLKYQSLCVVGPDRLLKLLGKGVDVGGDHSAGRCRQLHIDPELDITGLALFQILHFVLSIHRTEVYRPSILIDMELPRLRSLTLHGTRICLHHFVHHPTKFLEQIVHAAPSMTHLHVPQCSFSAYEIQVALGILQPAGDASRLPKSLRNLVIELDPVPTSLDSWAVPAEIPEDCAEGYEGQNSGRAKSLDVAGGYQSLVL
ncbi:hypothetical protein B0H14DRAFT_2709502 [Mycena olivaceomarginata]|nr:hypothetical protein B0H14DRAFT_2709502 [Mycena olivaceomarginata]